MSEMRKVVSRPYLKLMIGVMLACSHPEVVLADSPVHYDQPPIADVAHGRCKVIVGNSTHSSKSCEYDMSTDGAFELWPEPPSNYYVALDRINGDTAEAYTNGGKTLGKVKRQGACWVGKRARICLWRK